MSRSGGTNTQRAQDAKAGSAEDMLPRLKSANVDCSEDVALVGSKK
jgi:hypothetical protein